LARGVDLFADLNKFGLRSQIKATFDVRAQHGRMAPSFCHHLPHSSIFAFEPVMSNYLLLKENTNSKSNISSIPVGFGSLTGKLPIYLGKHSSLHSLKQELNKDIDTLRELVDIDTIDQYAAAHQIACIDLLKLDVEGSELDILTGANTMLAAGQIKSILCEVGFYSSNQRFTSFNDIIIFLKSKGYYFYFLYNTVSSLDNVSFTNRFLSYKLSAFLI
jgi:FkbM family methyltransferase